MNISTWNFFLFFLFCSRSTSSDLPLASLISSRKGMENGIVREQPQQGCCPWWEEAGAKGAHRAGSALRDQDPVTQHLKAVGRAECW